MCFPRALFRFGVFFLLVAAIPLSASLTATPAQPAAGQVVTFVLVPQIANDTSQSITWNFGDGGTAVTAGNVLTTTHAYSTEGTFTATATYSYRLPTGALATNTERISVTVVAPNRQVTFSPAQPQIGQNVTFQAINFLTPTTIAWNFGDGATISSGGSVQAHVYNAVGTYAVQARDQAGAAAPVTVNVTVSDITNRQVTFSPAQPQVNQTVTFQAINFLTPTTIAWNFGDGTTIASGGSVQAHVYNAVGTYAVQARDQAGAAAPVTVNVTVSDITNRQVTFSPAQPQANQTVTFQAIHFLTPTRIVWNFGDGSPAVTGGSVQTHAYNKAGVFTVQARDQGGAATPVTAVVTVSAVANRQVTFSPVLPGVGQTVTFQALNFVTPNSIAWNFGDGSTVASGGSVQTHLYVSAGTYQVQAKDQGGQAAPISVNVTVVDNRLVTFSPASPNVGQAVVFQAQNFSAPNALSWDFGDGNMIASGSSVQNHVFNSAGTFIVKVKDAGNGTTPVSLTVNVVNKRMIQFTPAAGGKTGQTFQFQAVSFIAACIQWNFGDGTPAVQGTAAQGHVFTKPGTFVVTATDQCGNSSWTATTPVTVAPSQGPLAGFDVTFGLLRFEGGKTSIMVGQGTTGLAAFADLKFEGTGTLMVEWRIDGQPFRTDTANATFGQSLTLNSGHLPGLPTAVPGPHTVQIRFLKPATSFTLSPISYTVTTHALDQGPSVDKATPAEVEPGHEYDLKLEGKNFQAGTTFSFGKGVGVVGNPQIQSGQKATVKVFVAPTAKSGDRPIHAGNLQGSNDGPGILKVNVPVIPHETVPALVCTKLGEIPSYPIELKAPAWVTTPPPSWHLENGKPVPTPGGPPTVNVPTFNDATLLKWLLPFSYYDYVEVRFFRPSSKSLILTKQLAGSASSLPLSGDLMAELFQALKGSGQISANAGAFLAGQKKMQFQNPDQYYYGPGSGPSPEALYAKGLADGAGIAWQVAAFRVYSCVSDSSSQNHFNQPVEEAVSDYWLLGLPNTFTGITCGSSGFQKPKVSIQAVNRTAGQRDQQSGTSGVTGNTNFVGDFFELTGGFTLEKSPYAPHVSSGSPVKFPNLFIDWGDGSPARPVWGKIADGTWNKKSVITLYGGLMTGHVYQTEGAHTIRIFQLSEDDIQVPQNDFYATLGNAVTPDPPGETSYQVIHNILGGPNTENQPPAQADVLAGALTRAYMIYCTNVQISSYMDVCANGPVHLVSLEILNFPGHDIKKPGSNSSQDGVMIRPDLIAAYNGIYAVALQCDQALHARARLRYYGAGSVQMDWYVDGHNVQTKTYSPLNSEVRKNLTASGAENCGQALVSELIFESEEFPVTTLGKHTVFVRAFVVPTYALSNLPTIIDHTVQKIGPIGTGATGADGLAAGHGPAFRGFGSAESKGTDLFAAQLAIDKKNGQPVPQIGFLSPNTEAGGGPPVVYLNDALESNPAVSSEGPWPLDESLASDTILRSETKGYMVNEVGDIAFCQIRFPTSGGEFIISDFGAGIQLNGLVYDGNGILSYKIRTGGGAVEKAFLSGLAFKGWSIEETSGLLKNGSFDVAAKNAGALSFPANVEGSARRFQGQVNGQALHPLIASFDLTLKGKQGTFLLLAEGPATGGSPEWKSVEGGLTAEGDWIASGSSLPKTAIGLTGFLIASPAVTFDFSVQAAGPGASGASAAAGWTGVLLGQAVITPATFNLAGSQPLKMNNVEPWMLTAGGLFGLERSGSFIAKIEEASVNFNHMDFQVSADYPTATYYNCAIHVPWIGAVLKGNAVMAKKAGSSGEYVTDWNGLSADPVTLSYEDKGRLSMVVTGLTWGRDSRGWRAQGQAAMTLEADGLPFAAFALNGLNFGTDARAYFTGPDWDTTIPLSGASSFGGATAALQNVQVESSSSGEDRLAFHVATQISISPDSSYIPSSDVVIHYKISRAGANYIGTGPWNSPFSTNVVFPLGSQEVNSAISPNYTGASSSPASEASANGFTGISGPFAYGSADIPNARFGGEIDLGMFGCMPVKGVFVLGYQNGKSFFLLFAKYDNLVLPMSPIPLSIFGIGGGFAYNFAPEVFRQGDMADAQPDLKGNAAFAAVMTIGTSDRYTVMGDGYLILSTQGSVQMGFDHLQFMQQGNFGGYIHYFNKIIDGKCFGSLDLIGGLINFSLGTEADPAVAFQFGGGKFYIYAGQKKGQRIKAKVWLLESDSYLEIDDVGIRMGGRNSFGGGVNLGFARAYFKHTLDLDLGFAYDPVTIEGSWQEGITAGGCLNVLVGEICLDLSVTASIYAHAPTPLILRATFSLDFDVDTVSFTVEL